MKATAEVRVRGTSILTCVTAAMLVVLCFPSAAAAYIDPGAGSLAIQVLLGTLLACGFALKIFWRQVWSFVGRIFRKKRPADPDPATRGRTKRQDLDDAPLSKSGYRSMVKLTAFRFTRDLSGAWIVSGRVHNTGTRTLSQVEVTVTCLDADKAPIYTEKIYPVFTREIDVPDVPYTPALKPSATADFRSTIAPDALGAEPKHVRASVTNVEFAF